MQPNGSAASQPSISEADAEAEILRLAGLSDLTYGRERKAAGEKLDLALTYLDKLVKAKKAEIVAEAAGGGAGDGGGQGRPIDLPEPKPWAHAVNGAALLDEAATTVRQYVILSEPQADAIALWIVFTFAFDVFDFSPKIVVCSAVKRSGKSRLVEVLERTTQKPLLVSGISPSALLRVVDQHAPSMLIDEIDTMMRGGDSETRETLRGLMNSGFSRAGARFIKNVPTPGGGYEAHAFSTWCPMLLAGIGKVPDTVADRSISIEMVRKRADEKVKRLRRSDGPELWDIGRKAARWVADNLNSLRLASPDTPEQLHDRAADAWSPLLAIADAAGGNWSRRARRAAVILTNAAAGGIETELETLLTDIKIAFDTKATDRLASEELVEFLRSLVDRPWPEFKNEKPITQAQLARLVKKFGVSSGSIRLNDGRTPKGYYRSSFEDAFERYLPPPLSRSATPPQPQDFCGSEDDLTAPHKNGRGVPETAENPSVAAACGGVAAQDPGEPPKSERVRVVL